ncbi:MAG: preprotein translocase subunit YajC [Deltaproteobacteria bacterium]|nr:preprotein translocase subunit YajC [Deltaproteobacteria bacterium]MBW2399472.1 preprotein translocase subunit YajC [Deltaproteobacteria bacterium]MBW2667443.1 preprotein translocase subunit YajC [Deltaproteobacteria bacterium]
MNLVPAFVLLQAGDPAAPPPFVQFLPLAAIFVIFYFLLIRPQQKRQREQEAMVKAVAKGDDIVTTGGLHGRVTGVTDDVLTLEIANIKGERVRVKVDRSKVDSRRKEAARKDDDS